MTRFFSMLFHDCGNPASNKVVNLISPSLKIGVKEIYIYTVYI